MKFIPFILVAFLTMLAPAVARSAAAVATATNTSGLRRALGAPSSDNRSSSEICVPAASRYSQVEAGLVHGLAARVVDSAWTGLTKPGQPDPTYAMGCGFLDFKCYVCDLCEDIYGALVDTGSEAACDLACIGIAEAAGGGPEDPIADVVAAACIPLCAAIFSAVGSGTAQSVCKAAQLC